MTMTFAPGPILAEIDLRLRQMARREQRAGATIGITSVATRAATESMVALQLGIHQRRIARLREREHPLTEWQADDWAIRLGKHPAELWPSWWDGLDEALAAETPKMPVSGKHCRKDHPMDRWEKSTQRYVCGTCANARWAARRDRLREMDVAA